MRIRENVINKAFTMVEVALVLVFIGIIAGVTIVPLFHNVQDFQYKIAYKKAFSNASQALSVANSRDLIVYNNTVTDNYNNFNAFMTQFKVAKICISNNNDQCWESTGELFGKDFSSGYPVNWCRAFIDSSGMSWTLLSNNKAEIAVDTNGSKKPNKYGKDRFVIFFYSVENSEVLGIPVKVIPWSPDNIGTNWNAVCFNNWCGTPSGYYYGNKWLNE